MAGVVQVVSDLGCMLEAMRQQQADVEEKVGNLQTAVQHLLPAPESVGTHFHTNGQALTSFSILLSTHCLAVLLHISFKKFAHHHPWSCSE